jgi:hypothetical protein
MVLFQSSKSGANRKELLRARAPLFEGKSERFKLFQEKDDMDDLSNRWKKALSFLALLLLILSAILSILIYL